MGQWKPKIPVGLGGSIGEMIAVFASYPVFSHPNENNTVRFRPWLALITGEPSRGHLSPWLSGFFLNWTSNSGGAASFDSAVCLNH